MIASFSLRIIIIAKPAIYYRGRFAGFQKDVDVVLGSKEQDIYDFAEILYEVITREEMPKTTSDSVGTIINRYKRYCANNFSYVLHSRDSTKTGN